MSPALVAARIRALGWTVLALGWGAAALIYVLAGADADADAAAAMVNSRLDDYTIERIGGKAAVYAARFNHWLGGLWHGRPLAATVAVLALVFALACLWLAHLAALPVPDGAEPDDRA